MVARKLKLDDSLFEEQGERSRFSIQRGRADNTVAVALVLAVVVLVLLAVTYDRENWWAVFLLGLLFLASELFALPVKPSGRLSVALFPVVIAMMVSGPLGAAIVTLFGIPVFLMERGEHGFRRVVFNACQYLVAAGVAAWLFYHPWGEALNGTLENAGKLVLPWVIATVVFYLINTLMVTPVLTPRGERMLRFWQMKMLPKLPSYIFFSGVGFIGAIVYLRLEFPAVVLLFAPLLAIRVVYTRYETMREVCDDTTFSIMEAVEGSGVLPPEHSIGVADMAVAIAEEMNFSEEDIHYLRQAALLHDIGKLALDPKLFAKEGRLTPEEFEEMKKHPLIGGEITSTERSFAAVAPAITHHHEMTDGSGYLDGLSAESIPVGARILGVADAYDAMQRQTPYREPYTPYKAASEIVRAKGIQFDNEVVDAFIAVVTRKGIWSGALREKVEMPSVTEEEKPGESETGSPEQPTLEEAAAEIQAEGEKDRTSTPAEGIKYTEVRGEIEKDIHDWKRSERERKKAEEESEKQKRAGFFPQKKGEKTEEEEE